MPVTFTLPDTITKKDREQIQKAVDIALRNARITEQYPDMLKEYGSQKAWEKLAKKFNVTKHTVHDVIYRHNM